MGALPPSIPPESIAGFPVARMIQVFRGNVLDRPGNYATVTSAVSDPWYTRLTRVSLFDSVEYDYETTFGRNTVTGGSGLYVNGRDPSYIYVSAPPDRALPFVAWTSLLVVPFVTANCTTRIGIVRHGPMSETSDYKLIAECFDQQSYAAGDYHTLSAFGFDVCPPNATLAVSVGADAGSTPSRTGVYDDGQGNGRRNRFGVMTF